MQAATRVKPEQASKVKSRTPTRLNNGEGSMGREVTDARTGSVRRGNGNGRQARRSGSLGEARDGRSGFPTSAERPAIRLGVGEARSTVEAG